MAKKKYMKPLLLDGGFDPLTDSGDPVIIIGASQGSEGHDSQFTWGEGIDADDIELFEELFGRDETILTEIDTDKNFLISQEEFYAWWDANV
ncbi:MAG: hypothetical protein Q4D71_12035 [Oscillospiraceae bacterium]|nr:hypothetical protein [Oscillospiraceae bacterium]